MDYFWNFIELGILIILVIILILLIVNKKNNINKIEESDILCHDKESRRREERRRREEIKRREKESSILSSRIENQLQLQKKHLSDLENDLYLKFEGNSKTYTKFSRNDNPPLHSKLCDIFGLNKDEKILYCRRYGFAFASDNYFIITEKGVGFSSIGDILDFYYIEELIERGDKIEFRDNKEVLLELFVDDCVYVTSKSEKLITSMNNFLKKYKSPLDIYHEAGFEALEKKLTPILPVLIEKIGNYHQGWKKVLRANYKFLLASEGEKCKNYSREALDDITDVEKMVDMNTEADIYYRCELLKVRIKMLNHEDPIEIKKILDTIEGKSENPEIQDEAAELRRELIL